MYFEIVFHFRHLGTDFRPKEKRNEIGRGKKKERKRNLSTPHSRFNSFFLFLPLLHMSAAIQACTQSAIDYSEIPKSYKSRYAWRVDYRAYVKRTGKSQDFLVRHSKVSKIKKKIKKQFY